MLLIMDNAGIIVGVLDNDATKALPYKNDVYKENLEPLTLTYTFETLGDHPDSNLLMNEGAILKPKPNSSEFYFFQIKAVEDVHRDGIVVRKVYCESLAVTELLGHVVDPINFQATTLSNILNTLLLGSGWALLVDDRVNVAVENFHIESHTNALYAIRQVLELFELEAEYSVELKNNRMHNQNIRIKHRIGADAGVRFVYDENLTGVSRYKDTRGTMTAVVAIGSQNEDGSFITLFDLPQGINVSEMLNDDDVFLNGRELASRSAFEQFSVRGKHITGLYTNQSAENPIDLLQKAYAFLTERADARYTYEIDAALLHELPSYQHREVQIGDMVFVQDMTFIPPLLVKARIIEITLSETNPEDSSIVIGDFITLTPDTNLEIDAIQQQIRDAEARLNQTNNIAQNALDKAGDLENSVDEVRDNINEVEDNIKNIQDNLETITGGRPPSEFPNLVNIEQQIRDAQQAAQDAINHGNQVYDNLREVEGRIDDALDAQQDILDAVQGHVDNIFERADNMEGRLDSVNDRVTETELDFQNRHREILEELSYKVDIGIVESINQRVTINESQIIEANNQIKLRARQTELNEVTGRVERNEASLIVAHDQIAQRVTREVFDELGRVVENQGSEILQNTGQIALRVTQEDFDTKTGAILEQVADFQIEVDNIEMRVVREHIDPLSGQIVEQGSQIRMLQEEITLKVDNIVVDQINQRVSNNEAGIFILNNEVALRAHQTEVDRLTGRVEKNEASISVMPDMIVSQVRQTITDPLTNRVSVTESNIIQTAEQITQIIGRVDNIDGVITNHGSRIQQTESTIGLMVTREEFNTETGRIEDLIAGIEIDIDEGIIIQHVRGITDPIEGEVQEVGGRIRVLEEEITLKVDNIVVDQINQRVSDNEAGIVILNNEVALRAHQTEVDRLTGKVDRNEASISVMPDQILSSVRETITDDINDRMTFNESQIAQNSREIALRLLAADFTGESVLSAIEMAPEGILIQGDRIDLVGRVRAEHLETSFFQGYHIRGAVIEGGRLRSLSNSGQTTVQIEDGKIDVSQNVVGWGKRLLSRLDGMGLAFYNPFFDRVVGYIGVSPTDDGHLVMNATGLSSTIRLLHQDRDRLRINSLGVSMFGDTSIVNGDIDIRGSGNKQFIAKSETGVQVGTLRWNAVGQMILSAENQIMHFRAGGNHTNASEMQLMPSGELVVSPNAFLRTPEIRPSTAGGQLTVNTVGAIRCKMTGDADWSALIIDNGTSHGRMWAGTGAFYLRADGATNLTFQTGARPRLTINNSGGHHHFSFWTGADSNGYIRMRDNRIGWVRGVNPLVNLDMEMSSSGELTSLAQGTNTFRPVRALSFPTASSAKWKTSLIKLEDAEINPIDLINHTQIWQYHLDSNLVGRIYDKPKVGVISEMVHPIIRDEEGVDSYAMVSLAWGAIQELSDKVDRLEKDKEMLTDVVDELIGENKKLKSGNEAIMQTIMTMRVEIDSLKAASN